ncbi:MAG TPA: GNAT family N-acetyltransferase [Thiobacillaceae bacterium]
MSDTRKLPSGIKNRRRGPDEWDKTIVAFQSPYQLKDLCLDQSLAQSEDTTRVSRQEFKVRIATTEDRRKSASLLIETMYSWRGYEADPLHQDPNRITLVAHQENKVAGTVTLGLDGPKGLVVDELYKAEVDRLRAKGKKIAELTKLAVDESSASKAVLAALFHIAFIYAFHIHRYTDFVIEVNPRHERFYRRMLGFARLGEERMCPRVGAPAVLLHLDFGYIDRKIAELGGVLPPPPGEKSLYPYGFSKHDELGIARRLQGE